ncbi:hypothetical protein PQR63_21255 [Herbaspirillum rhizosphaerae]|uniref:Uncharacterized protein n=1 Tax=Herbaspirillum rhizosphaerae TaxID=346179 RepID=A0ABW8ZEH2_9BURK
MPLLHTKSIAATPTSGALIAAMIFARALKLLPLPIGCLASR